MHRETGDTVDSLIRNYHNPLNKLEHKHASDELLATLFVENNDESAFNELTNRFADKIYRLCLRITKSPQSAEDVLQLVFLKLIQKLGDFRGSSKLSTWIYSITTNECFNYIKKTQRYRSTHLGIDIVGASDEHTHNYKFEGIDNGDNPEDAALNSEQLEFLEKAIDSLSQENSIVYQLRDIEGLSNKQTAEMLGISVAAVKSRILRARNHLKYKLSEHFPEYMT